MSSENGQTSNYFHNNSMNSYNQQMTENINETDQNNLKNSLISSTTNNISENQWHDISSTSQNVPRNSQSQLNSSFNCNQQYYNHISTAHNHSIFGTGNHHYKINNTWNIPPLSCYQRLSNSENVFVNKSHLLDQSTSMQHQSSFQNKRYHLNIYQGMLFLVVITVFIFLVYTLFYIIIFQYYTFQNEIYKLIKWI